MTKELGMLKTSVSVVVHGDFTPLHAFKYLLFHSTLSPTRQWGSLGAEFLVKSLGFSEEEALSICSKVRTSLNSTKRPQLVVDYLQKTGFDNAHIRKIVCSYPKILVNDVENVLEPKIRVFQELGFSGSELGALMSKHPFMFSRGLESHINPALQVLKSVYCSRENLVKAMLKTQWLLSSNTYKYLQKNVALLRSYGVPIERIDNLIVTLPRLLLNKTERLQNAAEAVEGKLGISRSSGMFLSGVVVMATVNQAMVEPRIDTFRSFGWSDSDISLMLKSHPFCLKVSEGKMRVKLKFFMEELGYGSNDLARQATLLLYSTEKRAIPRNMVLQTLKKKKVLKSNPCLFSLLKLTESNFLKSFVLPYKDELPQLHQDYINMVKGSSVKR